MGSGRAGMSVATVVWVALAAPLAAECLEPEALTSGLRVTYDTGGYWEAVRDGPLDVKVRFRPSLDADEPLQTLLLADGLHEVYFAAASEFDDWGDHAARWQYRPALSEAPPPPGPGVKWRAEAAFEDSFGLRAFWPVSATWGEAWQEVDTVGCTYSGLTLRLEFVRGSGTTTLDLIYFDELGLLVRTRATLDADVFYDLVPISLEAL